MTSTVHQSALATGSTARSIGDKFNGAVMPAVFSTRIRNIRGRSLFQAHRRQSLTNEDRDLTAVRALTGLQVQVQRLYMDVLEQRDLASGTSSRSSKLIHGGLRYLEHYEFRMVRQALAEREALLANAPHIMWPLRFRLPHQPHLRPAWMIRAGLFLYDHLAKRERLPGSRSVTFTPEDPLKPEITRGFEYSDGWVDDGCAVCPRRPARHRPAPAAPPARACTGWHPRLPGR